VTSVPSVLSQCWLLWSSTGRSSGR